MLQNQRSDTHSITSSNYLYQPKSKNRVSNKGKIINRKIDLWGTIKRIGNDLWGTIKKLRQLICGVQLKIFLECFCCVC